jgi:tetratricopeptide (TPR) repeat protein
MQIIPKTLLQAFVLEWMGEIERARAHYETARSMLEAELEQAPDDARLHSSLGLALAGLGREAEAKSEGERAVELLPVSKDALFGSYMAIDLADIYTRVGEYDAAVDQLEYVLSIPAEISVPLLRIDPRWDPLRDHPGFQRLLEKGAASF